LIDLSELRKLLVFRVLRPDAYTVKLHEIVKQDLNTELEYDWKKIFRERSKIIIINASLNSINSGVYDMHKRVLW
jgi:hypothetical protein